MAIHSGYFGLFEHWITISSARLARFNLVLSCVKNRNSEGEEIYKTYMHRFAISKVTVMMKLYYVSEQREPPVEVEVRF